MKKTIKLSTKEKTQAQQEADDYRTDEMIRFWFTYNDWEWNPFFLPLPDGWYEMNAKCKAGREDFERDFRAYFNRK